MSYNEHTTKISEQNIIKLIEKMMHKKISINDECFYHWAATGCMDTTASNYDSVATMDDGSCTYGNLSRASLLFSKKTIK